MSRVMRAIARAWHRWLIEGDLAYLRACERDGLVDSLSLREFRRVIAAREVKLILLQEPM